MKLFAAIFLFPALASVRLLAQTAVTTPGTGNWNRIPYFTSDTSLSPTPLMLLPFGAGTADDPVVLIGGNAYPHGRFSILSLPLGINPGDTSTSFSAQTSNPQRADFQIQQSRVPLGAGWDPGMANTWYTAVTRTQNTVSDQLINYTQYGLVGDPYGMSLGSSEREFIHFAGGGYVGIGTAQPQKNLSVQGGQNIDQGSADDGTVGTLGSAGLTFGSNSGEGIASPRTPTAVNHFGLDFFTAGQKRMSIVNATGNVGIGTATPATTLEVNGPVRAAAYQLADGSPLSTGPNLTPGTLTQANGVTAINSPLFVGGNSTTNTSQQGTYLSWNLKNGATGETDFINHRGSGPGGFAFYNTGGDGSTRNLLAVIDGNGNLGLGTESSGSKLEINGSLTLTANSGASVTFPDQTTQSTAWNGVLSGGDYAESVDVSGDRETYEPGDVMVIDPVFEGKFLKSSVAYATTVTGVYSTKPGVIGRRQMTGRGHMKDEVPMAMTGIVPTKVSAENGPIKAGDLLVSSSRVGYAMKGTDRARMLGAVIGKAIGHLDSGTGTIEAVVTLQ